MAEVEFTEEEVEPVTVPVREIEFTEDEVEPIAARPYEGVVGPQVIYYSESEAEPVTVPVQEFEFSEAEPIGRPYEGVIGPPVIEFTEAEAEAVTVPVREVVFTEDEVEPVIVPVGELVFADAEVESIVATPGPRSLNRSRPYQGITQAPVIDSSKRPVAFARVGLTPVERTTGLTLAHRELLHSIPITRDQIEPFWTSEAARTLFERLISATHVSKFLGDYKDRWVRAHQKIIRAAAEKFDMPAWVLAGVAWTEVGGDPPWTDEAQTALRIVALRDPTVTSFGPVQIQVRRAAEELGYDPKSLSSIQRRAIILSLLDPQQNLFIVASHLNRLRNVDARGKGATDLTDHDVRLIGARYSRGPELTRTELLYTGTRTRYGDDLVKKKERVSRLLDE